MHQKIRRPNYRKLGFSSIQDQCGPGGGGARRASRQFVMQSGSRVFRQPWPRFRKRLVPALHNKSLKIPTFCASKGLFVQGSQFGLESNRIPRECRSPTGCCTLPIIDALEAQEKRRPAISSHLLTFENFCYCAGSRLRTHRKCAVVTESS